MASEPEALIFHDVVRQRPGTMGKSVPRDDALPPLRGEGTYVADIRLKGMVDAAFVRSPLAHGRLVAIDPSAAFDAPGVLAAIAHDGLDNVEPFPDMIFINKPVALFPLARDVVRYVGAPLAVVIADSRYAAEDGVQLVDSTVQIDPLPTVASIAQGLADDAPLLYPAWGNNRVVDLPGNKPHVRAKLDSSPRRFQETYSVQRQAPLPMETRGVVAEYRDGHLTVWSSTQSPHIARTTYAMMLGLREADVTVICPRVGGGFGVKTHIYAEELVVARMAMKLRRPVRWIEDRAEHLITAGHSREQDHVVDVGYDDDGNILAIRCHVICDVGSGEIFMPGTCTSLVTGGVITAAYDFQDLEISTTCVVTNKTPSGAYRGFGAPEGVFVFERIIERVARLVGKDPNEIRARMLLTHEQMPYTMAGGGRVDSGSHQEAFALIRELAETSYQSAKARHADDPNTRVGVGYCNYVEPAVPTYYGTTGHWVGHDSASIRIEADGGATVAVGVSELGQGMVLTTRMVAADALGMDLDDVRVVMGDTDRAPYGLGSWGSRGAVVMAGSVVKAAEHVVEKAKQIAAHLLEASEDDIVMNESAFVVRGSESGRSVTWRDVADAGVVSTLKLPVDVDPGLDASATYEPFGLEHFPDERGLFHAAATWPNIAQAVVVAVDMNTGHIALEDLIVVHDCGVVIHPAVVDGQILGGVAQGVAGAMYENLVYDLETSAPKFASFMEYLVPTATEIPRVRIEHLCTPAPDMPLGIKGAGEAGTIGPPVTIANAVCHALSEFDLDIRQTPVTPEVVLAAIGKLDGAQA